MAFFELGRVFGQIENVFDPVIHVIRTPQWHLQRRERKEQKNYRKKENRKKERKKERIKDRKKENE